jgi:flagellar biosynthesis/type III secretory pathway chaperone
MQMWEQFYSLMSQLYQVYQQILTLSRQKKSILVSANPAELAKVVKEEEVLLFKAGKLDAARNQVFKELISTLVIPKDKLTLQDLIALAPVAVAAKLRKTSQDFDAVLAELKNQNELNTKLIQQALNLVNYNINLLTNNSVGLTYSAQGNGGKSIQGRSRLDYRG